MLKVGTQTNLKPKTPRTQTDSRMCPLEGHLGMLAHRKGSSSFEQFAKLGLNANIIPDRRNRRDLSSSSRSNRSKFGHSLIAEFRCQINNDFTY